MSGSWLNGLKVAILLFASASIVGGAIWVSQTNKEPIRDEKSLCVPALENGHTIVLIDKTDLWNSAQADRLESHIWWLVSQKLKSEERLSIFAFNDQLQPGFPALFSFCKPPSGEAADDIIKSRDYYNRQYKRQFVDPLKGVLENVKKAEEKECSPIMEVLFDVLMRREVAEHPGPTRIVLISDLAQNSPLYSFYLNTRCLQQNPKLDHRGDTSKIVQFILDRADSINKRDISAIVFQVVPEKNAQNIAKDVKVVWTKFFQYFGKDLQWEML